MKTLHSGSSEFPYVRTEEIAYSWSFEEPEDHEHPFLLTVTVNSQTRSEGFEHDIGEAEAAEKAEALAQEVYATTQSRD